MELKSILNKVRDNEIAFDVAEAQIRSMLRGAERESAETAIRILHPDWSDNQVDDELKAIGADTPEMVNASAESRIKAAQEKLKNEQK